MEVPLTGAENGGIILFASELNKLALCAQSGGESDVEKDCGAWINLLSHKLKRRLDATFQDLGITGVQSG